jgi:ABC-type multidrug transport system fused ATPase/permease subunit
MKWLDRGAAFRAGIVLASAILWTLVVVAGMVFLGVVTHLFWIMSVLAAVVVIATIVAFVQAWQERERRRAFRRTHAWAEVHREEEHLLKGADQYCTSCRLLTRNSSTKENGDRLRF